DAVQVDANGLLDRFGNDHRLAGRLLFRGWVGHFGPLRVISRRTRDGNERRPKVFAQSDEKGSAASRKSEIEVQIVVHRIEIALPDEIEVVALGIERRVGI